MTYRRNVELNFSPVVEVLGQSITITTGSYMGKTRYECKGELSLYCAQRLVVELRKALRQIRDAETRKLNAIVEQAERAL